MRRSRRGCTGKRGTSRSTTKARYVLPWVCCCARAGGAHGRLPAHSERTRPPPPASDSAPAHGAPAPRRRTARTDALPPTHAAPSRPRAGPSASTSTPRRAPRRRRREQTPPPPRLLAGAAQDPSDPRVVLEEWRGALRGWEGTCGGCGAGVRPEDEEEAVRSRLASRVLLSAQPVPSPGVTARLDEQNADTLPVAHSP